MKRPHILALSVALGLGAAELGACVDLAPTYRQPALPTPAAFPTRGAYPAAAGQTQSIGPWRDFFADPRLKSVIAEALVNNRDLRVAVANIAAARGQYVVQRVGSVSQARRQRGRDFRPDARRHRRAGLHAHRRVQRAPLQRERGRQRLGARSVRQAAQPDARRPGHLLRHPGGPGRGADQPRWSRWPPTG